MVDVEILERLMLGALVRRRRRSSITAGVRHHGGHGGHGAGPGALPIVDDREGGVWEMEGDVWCWRQFMNDGYCYRWARGSREADWDSGEAGARNSRVSRVRGRRRLI